MKLIKLNEDEFKYISSASFLSEKLRKNLTQGLQNNSPPYLLNLSEDIADEYRDLFGEQLQINEFDENYELTKEGAILESLIDKFFCG